MTSAVPFLMFQDGKGRPAMDFYLATLPNSHVVEVEEFDESGPGPAGTIKRGVYEIAGQRVMIHESFVSHAFNFTPSFSFFVNCDSEAEFDRLCAALSKGGEVMMPPGAYGWSRKFAWVADRFGVSWQLEWA